jgi:hemerythrin-like domain-containing protein
MSVGDARDAMNQMSLRANNWALGNFCQQQCLSFTGHHTLESDVNFPWLREHDPLVEAVIERLLAEHATIHDLIEDVDRALVHLVTHPGDFDQISDAVDLLVDTMLSHFAYEERELIAPMAQYGLGMGSM